MQYTSRGPQLGSAVSFGRLDPGMNSRSLQASDQALAVKLLNVSLSEIAIHYYESQILLREAAQQVANAFGVNSQRVVPLQLRPDDREPTKCTIWTFLIRDIPAHDQLGQLREILQRSPDALGQWHFGSRKVLVEPLITGSAGVSDHVSLPLLQKTWQRPGVEAKWDQEEELWLELLDINWSDDMKNDVSRFEDRLLGLRSALVSTLELVNPRALQIAKYFQTDVGTAIGITPVSPDTEKHKEHLKQCQQALDTGALTRKVPWLAENFPAVRSSQTGRPVPSVLMQPYSSTSTKTPAFRVTEVLGAYSLPYFKAADIQSNDQTLPTNKPLAIKVDAKARLYLVLVNRPKHNTQLSEVPLLLVKNKLSVLRSVAHVYSQVGVLLQTSGPPSQLMEVRIETIAATKELVRGTGALGNLLPTAE
ncbi:hypothetical protein cyc_02506 [Cyclospora cayetanensis]|uniref:Uncharacterized protein n=1 Tax=Cyclospora cayetanensis TaxID=88456 RepID=A0A1D3D0V8_9EIME|nr:hypothetical protein cyc_02506 [Cyclospora cayetanensis]